MHFAQPLVKMSEKAKWFGAFTAVFKLKCGTQPHYVIVYGCWVLTSSARHPSEDYQLFPRDSAGLKKHDIFT